MIQARKNMGLHVLRLGGLRIPGNLWVAGCQAFTYLEQEIGAYLHFNHAQEIKSLKVCMSLPELLYHG